MGGTCLASVPPGYCPVMLVVLEDLTAFSLESFRKFVSTGQLGVQAFNQ